MDQAADLPNKQRGVFFVVSILLVSIVLLGFFTSHATLSVDPPARYLEAKAIVDHGRLDVELIVDEGKPPGIYLDEQGKRHSMFGIGQSLIFTGPYYVCRHILGIQSDKLIRSIISITVFPITLGLTSLVFFALLREFGFSVRASYVAAILVIVATGLWQVSKEGQEDSHIALLFALTAYGLRRYENSASIKALALSALTVGYAFIMRSDSTPIVVCYFVFVFYLMRKNNDLKRLAPYVVVIGITLSALLLHCYVSYVRFGNPIFGGLNPAVGNLGPTFSIYNLPHGIRGFLYSPGRSIFLYNPVLIISVMGMFMLWRKHRAWAIFILAVFISLLLLLGSFVAFHGNCNWGPRYFCRILPLLFIPAVFFGFGKARLPGLRRWVFVVITTVSVLVQIAAVSLHHNRELGELAHAYNVDWSARYWTMFEPEANFLKLRVINLYSSLDEMINDKIEPWPTELAQFRTQEEHLRDPILHYLAFWPFHLTYYLPAVKPGLALPLWASTSILLVGVTLALMLLWLGYRASWRLSCEAHNTTAQD